MFCRVLTCKCCPDCRFHTVTAGRGAGKKLMLLVHGFPELWYSWRWQLEAFKDEYEVVAFDLRGYGQTEKPKVNPPLHMSCWSMQLLEQQPWLQAQQCELGMIALS